MVPSALLVFKTNLDNQVSNKLLSAPDTGDVSAVYPAPLAPVVEVRGHHPQDRFVQLLVVLRAHRLLTHLVQYTTTALGGNDSIAKYKIST